MRKVKAGGGWPSILYTLKKAREAGGFLRMYRALRSKNACKTCALGMGGQKGGMVNENGRFPEVCKKSVQAMAADLQGAIKNGFFEDFSFEKLRAFSPRELESAGRLTQPMFAGPLDQHYRPISWDEAVDRMAEKLLAVDPAQTFWYFSGRSSNEAGFLMQLLARVYGTNNVSNCSYYCHQASGVGLASVTGSGTATVVLEDVDRSDVLFVIGANPASNHPRFMRSMIDMKRRGGTIVVINPLKELGLVRFKVPSDPRSLLFGSTIADHYLQPRIGGDIALLGGILKRVIERDAVDRNFVERHAEAWGDVETHVRGLDWETLVDQSGIDRATMERIGDLYAEAGSAIFCWAMGITHHEHGVENVQAIANLAISRGMLGRPHAGLLPLRGHSNVQGVGSMGVVPNLKPGVAEAMQRTFDLELPTVSGLDTLESMIRAQAGGMRFASCLGGNLFGASPDAKFTSEALAAIDLVAYYCTTLNTGHVHGRGRETILLPVCARDEERQATTQESMFNYVRMSEGGRARYDGPREEVDIVCALAERVLGRDGDVDWTGLRDYATIRAAIAKVIPGYGAIGGIDATRREFQIDGRTFHEPVFKTGSGRAVCHVVDLPGLQDDEESIRLMTVRSEGQFNTVVYEDEDIYRGQERRDVILLAEADLQARGLVIDQPLTVRGPGGVLHHVLARTTDIPPGNAVMYFPEANALLSTLADPRSKTPAFKNVRITIGPCTESTSEAREPFAPDGSADRQDLKAC